MKRHPNPLWHSKKGRGTRHTHPHIPSFGIQLVYEDNHDFCLQTGILEVL